MIFAPRMSENGQAEATGGAGAVGGEKKSQMISNRNENQSDIKKKKKNDNKQGTERARAATRYQLPPLSALQL